MVRGGAIAAGTNADRAAATYAAMQRYLYVPDGASLYREEYPWQGGNPYSYLWPFARALIATLSLAGASDLNFETAVQDRFSGLARYWDARANPPAYDSYVRPPLGGGGDKYYDDNAWVALALVEAYRLGFATSLERADQLFELARSGWDRQQGGVFWVQQGRGLGRTNHDRGTGLNAGNAKLGFLLRELSGRSVVDAEQMLNWVSAALDSAGSGLYLNAIRRDGRIDTNVWSYVQGEMIGALALKYRVTHDSRYLDQAENIAGSTLSRFGMFTGQPASFNAMCFQALLLLSTLSRDAALLRRMLEAIGTYADWAWNPDNGARDAATNLFYFTSAGAPALASGQPAQLQDQAALAQIYSLLAWNPEDYSKLT